MNTEVILGIVRHVLTSAAGAAVAAGYMNNDQATQIIGGIVAAIGVGWSIWQKYQAKKGAQK